MAWTFVSKSKCEWKQNGTDLVLFFLILSEELSRADLTAVDNTLRTMRLHMLFECTPIVIHLKGHNQSQMNPLTNSILLQ